MRFNSKNFLVVPQTEEHTCGVCSMEALYRFHGVRTDKMRQRLGTDTVIEGTFPYDILRVLDEDGFEHRGSGKPWKSIRSQVAKACDSGHPVLTLTTLHDDWHWVVITRVTAASVYVADSWTNKISRLQDARYSRVHCSAVFVTPPPRGRKRKKISWQRVAELTALSLEITPTLGELITK